MNLFHGYTMTRRPGTLTSADRAATAGRVSMHTTATAGFATATAGRTPTGRATVGQLRTRPRTRRPRTAATNVLTDPDLVHLIVQHLAHPNRARTGAVSRVHRNAARRVAIIPLELLRHDGAVEYSGRNLVRIPGGDAYVRATRAELIDRIVPKAASRTSTWGPTFAAQVQVFQNIGKALSAVRKDPDAGTTIEADLEALYAKLAALFQHAPASVSRILTPAYVRTLSKPVLYILDWALT